MKTILPILILSCVVSSAMADGTISRNRATRLELQRGDSCWWDELFRQGTVSGEPVGKTRGTVLSAQGHFPKLKARFQGLLWKGKTFRGDGTFINRWVGFEAVTATVTIGESWFDGQPCVVMQYAADAPVFGGVRDELREIAPGTWLGRGVDSTTGRVKNYFLLQE
jgi:hypothetical protein